MHEDHAALIRQIAEALGYQAQERRPRESLNRFVEIIAPDGRVFGSAAGKLEIADLIAMAWDDALARLPDWTGVLNTALADPLAHDSLITAQTQGAGLNAEAICQASLARHDH
jgi:hypothetical protein